MSDSKDSPLPLLMDSNLKEDCIVAMNADVKADLLRPEQFKELGSVWDLSNKSIEKRLDSQGDYR